ncbi:MAG: hypothetical protein ACJAVQ_000761, partial [Nonlabens sp.]
MKKIYLFFLIIVFFVSCSSDDSCVGGSTINIGDISNEFSRDRFVEVYSDNAYKVYFPLWLSPNGDGINDFFSFYIKDTSNNIYFGSATFGIRDPFDENATDNPTGFISNATLNVSNTCQDLYQTSNINELGWILDFQLETEKGAYQIDLDLEMINGSVISIREKVDVVYPT